MLSRHQEGCQVIKKAAEHIKEAVETGEVTEIQRVPSERMLANCLTKNGASGEELLKVMRTGRYTLPQGWLQNWDRNI